MYLRINYQWCNREATSDLMLYATAFLPEAQHKEAVALDGLRVVFQTLEECTTRLDNKLSEIKISRSPRNGGDLFSHEDQILYTSVMSDIWITVDNIRRIPLFLKFIPGIPDSIAGPQFASIIDEIKGLRDSLHHIDERVKKYLSINGDSVLGDIFWRYREAPGKAEELNMLSSGVKRKHRDTFDLGILDGTAFLGHLGNYDLRIDYVIRPFDLVSKSYLPEQRIQVNLENAISIVNRIILFLNKKYSQFLSALVADDKTLPSILFPSVFAARLSKIDNK